MLKNKAGIWKSDDLWIFKKRNNESNIIELIYIENASKEKVIGLTRKGDKDKVILEDFDKLKSKQLWIKGEIDAEDYFTLINFIEPVLLTATSESDLEITGNITIYEMNVTS